MSNAIELQELPAESPNSKVSSLVTPSTLPKNQEPISPTLANVAIGFDSIQDLISSRSKRNQTVLCVFSIVACSIFLIFLFFLILGCIIGVILFFTYSNRRIQSLQATLETLGETGNSNLERTISSAFHELQSINSMIAVYGSTSIDNTSIVYCPNCTLGAPTVTPEQFYNFVALAQTRADTFLLRYCPIVYDEQRDAFEATVRRFIPDYFIWAPNRTMPTARRPVYNPVLYLYPDALNNTVAGVDNLFSPIANAIISRINITGQPSMTPRIRLVQETRYFYGFTLLTPVFKEAKMVGTVNGVFNMSKLTQDTFYELLSNQVDVVIMDDTGDVPEELQFLHSTISSDFSLPLDTILERFHRQVLQYNTSIAVGDRKWMLYYFPRDAYVDQTSFIDHILALLLSMGISLFAATICAFFFCMIVYSFVLTCITKERTNLLFKMLPRTIVNRISNGETIIADQLSNVTVLFADLVGFTQLSSQLPVTTLVALLNQLFCNMDEALLQYKSIEKIKTIGDCYMACSIPTHNQSAKDSAIQMGKLALQMLQIVKQPFIHKYGLELRIGLSSGECIAGVLGKQRPAYDVWGETVNLASRMESLGIPQKIQVSSSFKDLVDDEFEFEPRGLIQVKGKGMVETFFLVGPKSKNEVDDTVVGASSTTNILQQ